MFSFIFTGVYLFVEGRGFHVEGEGAMSRGVQIRLRCRHDSWAATLIRRAAYDNKNVLKLTMFRRNRFNCSLGFATAL